MYGDYFSSAITIKKTYMKKHIYGINANGDAMRTQVSVIRNYLEECPNHKVNQKFVTDAWGFTRLSAIIFNLKDDLEKEGGFLVVKDRRMDVPNRFGNMTHPKEYWIESNTLSSTL